jgi:hypothetical protein
LFTKRRRVAFPDDDFNTKLFADDAIPSCTCYTDDNTEEVLGSLRNNNATNVTEYLSQLNLAFGTIMGIVEYNCSNTCEHCFTYSTTSTSSTDNEYFCGILQTNESSTYQGNMGNFTIEEYNTGEVTEASWERLFSESSFTITTCMTYTVNEMGTICYSSNFMNLTKGPTCYVQYNDTTCNSCTFPYNPISDVNVTNNDCYIVDCTNIIPDVGMIDTCTGTGTGYNGILRFLQLIENGITNTTNVSLGSCTGPPTSLSPTLAPIMTEMTESTPTIIVTSRSSPNIASTSLYTVHAWIAIILILLMIRVQ